MKKLKYIFASLFVFAYNALVLAQFDEEDDDLDGGMEEQNPNVPDRVTHTEGAPATPIDTYEWLLLAVAVLLIVGYYVYSNRNKRIANS